MEKKKNFIINVVFYGMILVAGIAFCKFILPVLIPFLIAFLIAAIIQIPVKKIGKDSGKKKRIIAVLLCGTFYFIFFMAVILLGTKAVKTVWNMVVSAPAVYYEKVVPFIGEIADSLQETVASIDAGASQQIEEVFSDISQNMGQYISDFSVRAVKWLSGGVTGIPGFIVKLVVTVVATFFMAIDFTKMTGFFKRWIPAEKEGTVNKGMDYIKNVVFIYIKSYSLLFFMTFVELSIGLLILRIPYAVLLALGIAVFDILPVLGTGGILLPWAVILVVIGNVPLAIGILTLYIIITAIRNTMEPKIVGKQIGLHPLAAMVAMFIGLKVLGIIGMVVFPVTLAVIMNLEKNGVLGRKEQFKE